MSLTLIKICTDYSNVIKYIILIIIRRFHYVQVLLIKTHRRAGGVAAMSALLSEWHKSRCSSESPGARVKG